MKTCLGVCLLYKTDALETRTGGRGRREMNFCEAGKHFQMDVEE